MLGPIGDLSEAIQTARKEAFECAVLDSSLKGKPVDAIAEVLAARDIPLVCTTEDGLDAVPICCHDHFPVVTKPLQDGDLLLALRCVMPLKSRTR